MKATAILAALLLLATASLVLADPGIQVVDCVEVSPGVYEYIFFVCSGDFDANDLHIELVPAEIDEGTEVVGCSVPDLPGYDCAFDATAAHYFFPTVGPFSCVPGISGMYLGMTIATPDEFTIVNEIWTLDGVPVAIFGTSIACPPVPTEQSNWGTIKSMY